MDILIRLVIAASMASWVYLVAQKREKHPLGWAAFTFLAMPFPMTILGIRHRRWVMLAVGLLAMLAAFTAGMFLLTVFRTGDADRAPRFIDSLPSGFMAAFLLLVAMTLVARKRTDRFAIGIYLFIALKLAYTCVWPFINSALRENLASSQRGMIVSSIAATVAFLGLAILWAAWASSDREQRDRCFKNILYFTIAAVICAIIANIMRTVLGRFLHQQPLYVNSVLFILRSVDTVIRSLPLLILLTGAWRPLDPADAAHPSAHLAAAPLVKRPMVSGAKFGLAVIGLYVLFILFMLVAVNSGSDAMENLLDQIPDPVGYALLFGGPALIGIAGLITGLQKNRPGIGALALVLTPIGFFIALAAKDMRTGQVPVANFDVPPLPREPA